MKYAIRFYRGCRILNKADELIVKYTEREPELIKFVQSRPEQQRIVVNLSFYHIDEDTEDNISIFEDAYKAHKNFAVMFSVYQTTWLEIIKDSDIPFFFMESASTLDDFEAMMNYNISDIYISDELGFRMEKVSAFCKQRGVQVRVIPNYAQKTSIISSDTDIMSFFIRPDDTEFYEQFVDVFEFAGELAQQPVLYDIYRDGRWLGNLRDIILDLTNDIDNKVILPSFRIRANCGKKCVFNQCDICKRILAVGEMMKEKGLIMAPKKRQYEETISEDTLPQINEIFANYVNET